MRPSPSKPVLIFAGGGLTPVSGGVGTLLRYLMVEWAADPHALPVQVIDTRGAGGLACGLWVFGRAALAMVAARLRGGIACAHIHMTTRGSALRKAVLCLLARLLRIPVVLHLHGADFFEFHAKLPRFCKRALRWAIGGAEAAVVIGAAWRARLVRELGYPPDRISIVLNGVPAAPLREAGQGEQRILFLGRIGERKGVGDLIAALAAPEMQARAWSATIAGDGDRTPYLEQVAANGLQDRIDMPGWQDGDAAAALLARAAILVLPSHHEVMPVAVLEAMARGLAIVTTPVGSVPEILRDGVSARLVPPGEPAALAAALAALIDDPAERLRLGEAAHRAWAERLDVAVAAREIQAIYRAVIGPREAPMPSAPVVA